MGYLIVLFATFLFGAVAFSVVLALLSLAVTGTVGSWPFPLAFGLAMGVAYLLATMYGRGGPDASH